MKLKTHSANPAPLTVVSRRSILKTGFLFGAAMTLPRIAKPAAEENFYKAKANRIRQSVVLWCFKPMSVEELARNAVRLGMQSVELVAPEHWPLLKKLGLACAITPSHGFAKGFAHREEHAECLKVLEERINQTADAGFSNVITFSGFRRGLSTEEGIKNMVEGLKKIVGLAEKRKVNLCLEMLNSRVNIEMKGHPDYFCDNIEMAVDICKQIGSERMKLLFDIYHVQIMHGDVIARIRQHYPYIAHYHTAGNPGRGEIDDTQEINYPPVMKAILETGYQGFVGQEFIPTRDKIASLSQAVKICDV